MPILYDTPGTDVPTYAGLVDEVLALFQGYTAAPDQMAVLKTDISATDTTIALTGTDHFPSQCMVEIGDEMIFILESDATLGTLTALPQGRGWRSTTAAAHTAGDTVTISPAIPRTRAKRALNDVILSLYPSLFAIGSTEFIYSSMIQAAWEIPAEAESVLDVRYKDVLGNWQRIRGWEAEWSASGTASGKVVRITQPVPIGMTVRVVYSKRLSMLTNSAGPFTDSGLEASARDALVFGAAARLAPALDASRLSVQYVPADELDQPRQIGSAMAIAREFRAEFDKRVAAERATLNARYPARVHFTR